MTVRVRGFCASYKTFSSSQNLFSFKILIIELIFGVFYTNTKTPSFQKPSAFSDIFFLKMRQPPPLPPVHSKQCHETIYFTRFLLISFFFFVPSTTTHHHSSSREEAKPEAAAAPAETPAASSPAKTAQPDAVQTPEGVVLVRGLSRSINDTHITEILSVYGKVRGVQREHEGPHNLVPKDYAFVTFESTDDAEAAVRHLSPLDDGRHAEVCQRSEIRDQRSEVECKKKYPKILSKRPQQRRRVLRVK